MGSVATMAQEPASGSVSLTTLTTRDCHRWGTRRRTRHAIIGQVLKDPGVDIACFQGVHTRYNLHTGATG